MLAASISLPLQAAGPPRVVVSIAPLHSLIAGVMKGVAEPELLLRNGASPHNYSLRPSQMQSLSRARVLFWVGEGVEGFLQRSLAVPRAGQRIMKLMDLPGLTLLPARTGGVWETDAEEPEKTSSPHTGEIDPHIWLDPDNAMVIAKAAAEILSEADPEHAAIYRDNSDRLIFRLGNLDTELHDVLAAALNKPYFVFHDAYQYLEHRYGLKAAGSFSVSPEHRPGARRLREITARLKESSARCIFSEPQFPAPFLQTLTESGQYYGAELDPLGIDIPPGPDLYFILMRRLAGSLTGCLCKVYTGSQSPQRDGVE